MSNSLIIKDFGEEYTNRFGYPSRKVLFYDSSSKLSKEIHIHQRHLGHGKVWIDIKRSGSKARAYGRINKNFLTEDLIRSVDAYKDCELISFEPYCIFVLFNYSDLNEHGNLLHALNDQLYQYVDARNVYFDPYGPNPEDDRYKI